MTIRLTTLGGLQGTNDGVDLDWLPAQPLRAGLLTFLAVDRSATRDALQLLLWPDTETNLARHRLSQIVYELRRAVGDCIETNGRNIQSTDALTSDAVEFEAAVSAGRYEDAIPLYRGPFLAGVHLVDTNEFESWVDARRARHARMFRKASRGIVDARSQAGDLDAAQAAAESWVSGDPDDDEARHRLIELLARRGNRTEALRQFEIYSRRLESDGLEPLEETRDLIATLQRQSKGEWSLAPDATPAAAVSAPQANTPGSAPQPDAALTQRRTRLGADLDPRLQSESLHNLDVLREIAAGSSARVYLARDRGLQRLVAIKVPLPEIAGDPKARLRFEREARAAAKLAHPNVVTIHQVGELGDGTPYLVTEYVEGRNLADTLAAEGPLSEAEACSVLEQIAAALAEAHARGLIHRDVRPANIVWTRESGRAVLMDFGIVAAVESGSDLRERLTATGERVGDPAYGSPEQLRSDPLTPASDIYSLGVLGYELLTGAGPFPGVSYLALMQAHLKQTPASLTTLRPETNPELADLLLRCLNKKPELRPTAREIARAFERIQSGAAGLPRPVQPPTPRSRATLERVGWAVGVLFALALSWWIFF